MNYLLRLLSIIFLLYIINVHSRDGNSYFVDTFIILIYAKCIIPIMINSIQLNITAL